MRFSDSYRNCGIYTTYGSSILSKTNGSVSIQHNIQEKKLKLTDTKIKFSQAIQWNDRKLRTKHQILMGSLGETGYLYYHYYHSWSMMKYTHKLIPSDWLIFVLKLVPPIHSFRALLSTITPTMQFPHKKG